MNKLLYRIKEFLLIRSNIPYGFHKEEIRLLNQYYSYDIKEVEGGKTIIVMVDGRTRHNGLTDRFKGICSAFHFAISIGCDFKINYTFPFKLTDYLVPNKYDWTIDNNEIIYNQNSRPLLLNDYEIFEYKNRERYLKHAMGSYSQIHLYTNSLFGDVHFAEDFNILFRPSELLKKEIDRHVTILGSKYISISIRFQRLLGDSFEERNSKELDEKDKNKLIKSALNGIALVRRLNPNLNVTVFSDSSIFLKVVSERWKDIYIVPGKPVHIDNTSDAKKDSYLKTFVDFFVISRAAKIYLLYNDVLYKSGFPLMASKIGYSQFEILNIE